MRDDKETKGPERGSDDEVIAPVWCYQCKKQFSFRLKAGASQKKLPPHEVNRLVSAALNASKWQMLDVVDEDGEQTGQRTWFCETCVNEATSEFEDRRKKAKKPWWRTVR
jgi:hypothetical protein